MIVTKNYSNKQPQKHDWTVLECSYPWENWNEKNERVNPDGANCQDEITFTAPTWT